jgi:hypothetical protein
VVRYLPRTGPLKSKGTLDLIPGSFAWCRFRCIWGRLFRATSESLSLDFGVLVYPWVLDQRSWPFDPPHRLQGSSGGTTVRKMRGSSRGSAAGTPARMTALV